MKGDNAGVLGEKTEEIGDIAETDEVFGMRGQHGVIQVFQNSQRAIAAAGADNSGYFLIHESLSKILPDFQVGGSLIRSGSERFPAHKQDESPRLKDGGPGGKEVPVHRTGWSDYGQQIPGL